MMDVASFSVLLVDLAIVVWLFAPPRHWVHTALAWLNLGVSLALLLTLASRAHAADVVPETTPDGYAALVASFPEGADQVCIVREDAPAQPPECRVRPIGRGALQVALFLRKLEPGEVVCAYSVKGGVTSKLSEDCWVGPPAPVSEPRAKP